MLGFMNKWVKLVLLLLPSVLIGIGIIHAVTLMLGSGFDVAVNKFLPSFGLVTTGLVLGEFNKQRKDLY